MNREEAAVVIQKQIRGYQVRKQYGPQLKASLSMERTVYDQPTANMMMYYCRRWRTRSIFQVLLMYRAARLQDLVYFSQQVHLYCQGFMSHMQDPEKMYVSQANIQEVKPHVAKTLLGERPTNVCKVPFRFDAIPYFDTSMLCDPVDAGLDELYSDCPTRPGEQETWDAPLRRKYSLLHNDKKTKDQEVQTTSSDHAQQVTLQPVVSAHSSNPQIQIPFRRELLDSSPKRNRTIAANSTPSNKQQELGQNSEVSTESWPTNYDSQQQVGVGRRQFVHKNERNLDFPEIDGKPTENRTRGGGPHILELKAKSREIKDSTTDDSPFNFQAMLRKTNYNRQSLKRNSSVNGTDQEINDEKPAGVKSNDNFQMSSYSDVVRKRSVRKRVAPNPITKPLVNDTDKLNHTPYTVCRGDKPHSGDDKTFELLPGLVIQGEEAFL